MKILRFIMLLVLSVWIGALVFFPVVAATAFSSLPSAHLAGLVVRGSLLRVHWIAFVCGAAFLLCSLIYNRTMLGRARAFSLGHVLMLFMLALTALSQFVILPKMESLRAAAGEISTLAANDPIRAQFDSLHVWSTRVESAVLVLGISLLYVTTQRLATTRP